MEMTHPGDSNGPDGLPQSRPASAEQDNGVIGRRETEQCGFPGESA